MVLCLIILGVIAVGVETRVDKSLVESSGLLNDSLLGWQLIYIFPVAIFTNDFFISGFWMRTFVSNLLIHLLIGAGPGVARQAILLFETRLLFYQSITTYNDSLYP